MTTTKRCMCCRLQGGLSTGACTTPDSSHQGVAVQPAGLAHAALQLEQGAPHGPAVGTDAEVGLALHPAEQVHGPFQHCLCRQAAADGAPAGDAQALAGTLLESLLVH